MGRKGAGRGGDGIDNRWGCEYTPNESLLKHAENERTLVRTLLRDPQFRMSING